MMPFTAIKKAMNCGISQSHDRDVTHRDAHRHPRCDDGKAEHCESEHLFRSLWSVAHSEEEAHDQQTQVYIVEDRVDVFGPRQFERGILNGGDED